MFKSSQSLFYWKLLCNRDIFWVARRSFKSQSLFYWKLLCNNNRHVRSLKRQPVTILILLETPLQLEIYRQYVKYSSVTILILLETPLQSNMDILESEYSYCHNPYFTGNSFAMKKEHYSKRKFYKSQSLFYWKLLCNLKEQTQ